MKRHRSVGEQDQSPVDPLPICHLERRHRGGCCRSWAGCALREISVYKHHDDYGQAMGTGLTSFDSLLIACAVGASVYTNKCSFSKDYSP